MTEDLRLTEVLTTSSAIANYLGAATIDAKHLLLAVDVLLGNSTMDDLGRPISPLVSRATRAGGKVSPALQALAQRWFGELGGDPLATLDHDSLTKLIQELHTLEESEPTEADE